MDSSLDVRDGMVCDDVAQGLGNIRAADGWECADWSGQ